MTQTALITGATSGIGLAFAERLARDGYDLVLVARTTQRLEEVAASLGERHGVTVTALTADLSTPEGTEQVEQAVAGTDHPIDLLVNNAGFGLGNTFADNDLDAEQQALDVMVAAPMRLTHAALSAMLPRGAGAVINVSSVAGFLPRGTYSAHKAWLTKFSAWLHASHAATGVRVMALCPGFVHTEFHGRIGVDTSNIPRWMWLSADRVVDEGLADLARGRAVSVPSRRYKVLTTAARAAPDRVLIRFATLGR